MCGRRPNAGGRRWHGECADEHRRERAVEERARRAVKLTVLVENIRVVQGFDIEKL